MAKRDGLDTLWGNVHPSKFGTRSRNAAASSSSNSKRRRHIVANKEYKPQTPETRAAYEDLLGVIREQFGTQPPDVLAGAADELLTILKDDTDTNNDPSSAGKKKEEEVEKLLNHISDATFQQLLSIAERVTDFHHRQVDDADDHLVAVEFADSDHDDPGDDRRQVQVQHGDDGSTNQTPVAPVNVHDIDAHWLYRQMCLAFMNCGAGGGIDPLHIRKLAEEVLKVLANKVGDDDRDAETRLVELFNYGMFDLVKFLLRNRFEMVWCTRLARAQQDRQRRDKIEEEMRSDPRLAPILEQLLVAETRASVPNRSSGTTDKTK